MQNIKNFLNKIQIGYKCRSTSIHLYLNSENIKIVHFFYEKGWIKLYNIKNNNIIIFLRYINNKPLFLKIKFISTPGHRKYYSKEGLVYFKKSLGGNANILLYTSFGLKTLKFAENLAIGGEISYLLYE
jgi:ribosomal protein S8